MVFTFSGLTRRALKSENGPRESFSLFVHWKRVHCKQSGRHEQLVWMCLQPEQHSSVYIERVQCHRPKSRRSRSQQQLGFLFWGRERSVASGAAHNLHTHSLHNMCRLNNNNSHQHCAIKWAAAAAWWFFAPKPPFFTHTGRPRASERMCKKCKLCVCDLALSHQLTLSGSG
jgi:hypothetical protein